MPGTVKLHRVFAAPPERVWRAFTDPDAMAKWLPPHGFTGKVHHLDARVGGTYRMSFTNLTTGHSHHFGGSYLELAAGAQFVKADKIVFEAQAMLTLVMGASIVTMMPGIVMIAGVSVKLDGPVNGELLVLNN